MLQGSNEKYLLKFIACNDINDELLKIVSKLGLKPHSREYNPVYKIIDEINFSEIFKEKV
jgi:phage terminase small subunit